MINGRTRRRMFISCVLAWSGCHWTPSHPHHNPSRRIVAIGLERYGELRLAPVTASDGTRHLLVVDTGAGASIVLFNSLIHDPAPRVTTLPFILVGTVRNGFFVARPEVVYMQSALGDAVDGVMGLTLFGSHTVEFDFAEDSLRLRPHPTQDTQARPSCRIPFHMLLGVPVVVAELDGGDSVTLMIDTGSNAALTVSSPTVAARYDPEVSAMSLGGAIGGQLADPRKLRIGSCSFDSVTCILRAPQSTVPWQGSVGMEFLGRHRKLEFDFEQRVMILVP